MSKTLEREVRVKIDMNIPVSLLNNGNSTFIESYQKDIYQTRFIEGMQSEFQTSKVIIDSQNPEFVINISEFLIVESTSSKIVNDSTSQDHGKEFELSKLVLSSKGTVTRLENNAVYNWSATKDKEEKVKSNRTVIQLATGQNKETNEYREKKFSASESIDLSRNCGRRAGNSIVKEILRALK